ncbi:alpha-1,2-fucosyltransferase [Micrococcus luteus]|uniref:alpha-1,2-fucosyltransferase n=1 Tax=Micrococcus luteus TaxID=1270 RepID=UPI003650EC5C
MPTPSVRDLAAAVLSTVRRSNPPVIWGAEPMNGGNFLYLWATAWARRRQTGRPWLVRRKPKMAPWVAEFPALAELTVDEAAVRFRQQRTVEWGQQTFHDWCFRDLLDFADERLLTSDAFRARLRCVDRDAVVINVRRGDYYSDPVHRAAYGFDIAGYVRAAVASIPPEDLTRFVLVSDDVDWCRAHLGFLADMAPVETLPGEHDMFNDFAQIVGGRHIVLANSTFSYWGGYTALALPRAERPRSILAPLHFNRRYTCGESPLVHPQWTVIPDEDFIPAD